MKTTKLILIADSPAIVTDFAFAAQDNRFAFSLLEGVAFVFSKG